MAAVAGTDNEIALMDVADAARQAGEPLDTYQQFTREHHTFPNGCHIAEVEVDHQETGVATLDRYTAVDDYGVTINPLLVTGQAHGAIAQGVGQALTEHAVFDPESGNCYPAHSWTIACRARTICPPSTSRLRACAAPPTRLV